jgi:hypothetical protein
MQEVEHKVKRISQRGTSLMRKGKHEMKNSKIVVTICIVALLGLLAGRVVAQKPLLPEGYEVAATPVSQNALSPQGDDAVAATVASSISYQGRLTDPDSGAPLNGTYDLEFILWSASSGGSQVSPTNTRNAQTITNGLYSTELALNSYYVDGRELWLEIKVRETGAASWETLAPRVEVLPTAYALSLRPQARVTGSTARPYAIVMATNTSSGWGLRGESTEYTGYGVYGYNGSTSSSAYGGGVIGVTETDGYGVRGEAPSDGDFCYGGYFTGRIGVRGFGTGSNTENGYGGYFLSANYRGIYALSVDGWYDAYFAGIGGIYSAGGYFGTLANRTLVVNGGDETLEVGDVVAIAGIAEFPKSDEPILAVRKANGATDIAVVGVVVQAMRVQEVDLPDDEPGEKSVDVQPVEGDIPPGGYLAIVSHGLVSAVKVSVSKAESLSVGELLSLAAVPGAVQKAETQFVDGRSVYVEGTILGKVAGPFDPQSGTVPVFVTLQ